MTANKPLIRELQEHDVIVLPSYAEDQAAQRRAGRLIAPLAGDFTNRTIWL